jgi:hypothetical protein
LLAGSARWLRSHLVLLTHPDPALPIARLRGLGQLTEVRASDLRFTREKVDARQRERCYAREPSNPEGGRQWHRPPVSKRSSG